MTISDIIEAKQRILARYETPEYIREQQMTGKTSFELRIAQMDRDIILSELLIELMGIELAAQKATTPVNIEETGE